MGRSFKGLALTWVGRFLMTLGLIFVASRLWDYRDSVGSKLGNPLLLLWTLSFAVIYALSSLLLAFGWWLIIHSRRGCERQIRWQTAWPLYGKTQIAKYIPGNIFHFAGRHVLASKEGVSHSLLVVAATLEIVMLLLAASMISLLAVSNFIGSINHFSFRGPLLIAGGSLLAAIIVLIYLFRRTVVGKMLARTRWRLLFAAQLSYLLFSLISSGLFFSLISLQNGSESAAHWQLITGSYAFAWAVGFAVPGAPGGLGVREAVLVGVLSGVLPENLVLISAVLFRVVTAVGDNLFFLKAILFCRRPFALWRTRGREE